MKYNSIEVFHGFGVICLQYGRIFLRNIQYYAVFQMKVILINYAVRTSNLTRNSYLCVEAFIYDYVII